MLSRRIGGGVLPLPGAAGGPPPAMFPDAPALPIFNTLITTYSTLTTHLDHTYTTLRPHSEHLVHLEHLEYHLEHT